MSWIEKDSKLYREVKFKDFAEAIGFMTEAAIHIEKQNHHPEWSNVYNTVKISLTTHDAGNTVTDKDRKLAATIDQLLEKYN